MLLSDFISVRGGSRSFPQPCRVTDLHRDWRQSGYSLWLLDLMNTVLHHIMHNMHLLDFLFALEVENRLPLPPAFLSVKCGGWPSHRWPYFGCRTEGCWCRTSCGFWGLRWSTRGTLGHLDSDSSSLSGLWKTEEEVSQLSAVTADRCGPERRLNLHRRLTYLQE